jgi:hypothetical protein
VRVNPHKIIGLGAGILLFTVSMAHFVSAQPAKKTVAPNFKVSQQELMSRIEAEMEDAKIKAEAASDNIKKSRVLTEKNKKASLKTQEERNLQKNILERMNKSPVWLSYFAARANKFSYCDSTRSKDQCLSSLKDLMFSRSVAQGTCDDFGPNDRDGKNECLAFAKGLCNSLTGVKAAICKATTQGDINILLREMKSNPWQKFSTGTESKARYILGIYTGYKTSNEGACDNYLSKEKPIKRWSCNILFGNQSAQNLLPALSQDIAIAWSAKKEKRTDMCNRISDPTVKRACLDPNFKSMNDIFDSVWD